MKGAEYLNEDYYYAVSKETVCFLIYMYAINIVSDFQTNLWWIDCNTSLCDGDITHSMDGVVNEF